MADNHVASHVGIHPNETASRVMAEFLSADTCSGALLIEGPWGSGKTHFVKKVLEDHPRIPQHAGGRYYVSLFGLSSINDINSAIFTCIHPVLGHPSAKKLGRIIKSSIKLGLKIDIDGDDQSDGVLNIAVDDESGGGNIANISALILDDIERYDGDLNELLGFIHYYVEHAEIKIAVCANWSELIRQYPDASRFKEKVFGHTIHVVADIDQFLSSDSSNIQIGSIEDISSTQLRNIWDQSGCHNLRLLERLCDQYKLLKLNCPRFFVREEARQEFCGQFFAVCLVLLDNLDRKDCYRVQHEWTLNEEGEGVSIAQMFPFLDFGRMGITTSQWLEIAMQGRDCYRIVADHAHASGPAAGSLAWYRLWHAVDLTPDGMAEAVNDFSNAISTKEYCEIGMLVHSYAIAIWLRQFSFLDDTTLETEIFDQIVNYAAENLDRSLASIICRDPAYYSMCLMRSKDGNLSQRLKDLSEAISWATSERVTEKLKSILDEEETIGSFVDFVNKHEDAVSLDVFKPEEISKRTSGSPYIQQYRIADIICSHLRSDLIGIEWAKKFVCDLRADVTDGFHKYVVANIEEKIDSSANEVK